MRGGALLHPVVGLVVLSVAGPASAADYKWCVDATGQTAGNGWDCINPTLACENAMPLTSIADALALAAAQPDLSDGSRPEHEICVMSLSPHTEAVSIDNTDGVLGGHLLVGFQPSVPQNVCPLAPGVPIFDASGPPGGWDLEIVSLQSDQVVGRVGACPAAGPVVFAEGTSVAVRTTVVLGATGPLFSFAGTGIPEHLSLISSRFDAGLGPVVSGASQVFIDAVEIAGFHSIGAPLIGGGGAQHRRHGAVRQCR